MLNIVQVLIGVQVHGVFAAPIDLPPAGNPLGDGKAFALPRLIGLHQPGQFGPRANQTHLAF